MKSRWISNALLVFVLTGAGLAACGGANPEGKYRASDGSVTLELKSGKAGFNYGPVHIDGAYTVDGDKLTIRPLEGATALTGPPGMDIQRLEKTK
jgi:hypothetical protein